MYRGEYIGILFLRALAGDSRGVYREVDREIWGNFREDKKKPGREDRALIWVIELIYLWVKESSDHSGVNSSLTLTLLSSFKTTI